MMDRVNKYKNDLYRMWIVVAKQLKTPGALTYDTVSS